MHLIPKSHWSEIGKKRYLLANVVKINFTSLFLQIAMAEDTISVEAKEEAEQFKNKANEQFKVTKTKNVQLSRYEQSLYSLISRS